MWDRKSDRSRRDEESISRQQVLKWAMCQPGVLLLNRLALGATVEREAGLDPGAVLVERPVETEADMIDGDLYC